MLGKQKIKDYPDVLDINQMCELIGVGLTTGYKLIRLNEIPSKKIGRSYRILKRNVVEYLEVSY